MDTRRFSEYDEGLRSNQLTSADRKDWRSRIAGRRPRVTPERKYLQKKTRGSKGRVRQKKAVNPKDSDEGEQETVSSEKRDGSEQTAEDHKEGKGNEQEKRKRKR